MRHGRLIGGMCTAMAWTSVWALLWMLAAAPAAAQEGHEINVRGMVLAETRIQPGAQQLLQVTVANTSKGRVPAGLRAELRDERDRRVGSPQRRKVVLAAKDEERFLFKFAVPSAVGDYAIRFEVLTDDFKDPLIPGGPVYFSPFRVGEGRPQPRPATMQQARISPPSFLPPSGLNFERPDLLWEGFSVTPSSVLLGETLRVRADLRNVGGDLARNVQVRVVIFSTRTPDRTETVSETTVQVLAPGEKLEMEFETVLPDDALLGEYQIRLEVDVNDTVDELSESNNTATSNPVRLSRIKLIFPEPGFAFEEQGLFLFRWDSLRYDEFKVQVGTEPTFSEEANFFDLPQGGKWTREKEIVPLEGELPAMALGLAEKTGAKGLYWRVLARDSQSDRTAVSQVFSFTITPEPAPQETRAPATQQGTPQTAPQSEPAAPPPTAPQGGGGGTPEGTAPAAGAPQG